MTRSEFQIQGWMMLVELRLAAREADIQSPAPARLNSERITEIANVFETLLLGRAANENQPVPYVAKELQALVKRSR